MSDLDKMREIRNATNQALAIAGRLQSYRKQLFLKNETVVGNLKARIETKQFSSYPEKNALYAHMEDRANTISAVLSYLDTAILQLNKTVDLYKTAFKESFLAENKGEDKVFYSMELDPQKEQSSKPLMPALPERKPNNNEDKVPSMWAKLDVESAPKVSAAVLFMKEIGKLKSLFDVLSGYPAGEYHATFKHEYKLGEDLYLSVPGTGLQFKVDMTSGLPEVEGRIVIKGMPYVVKKYDYNRTEKRVYFFDIAMETVVDLNTRKVKEFVFHKRKKVSEVESAASEKAKEDVHIVDTSASAK